METEFYNWINDNKSSVTRPEKYTKTITTISNHLKSKIGVNLNLYDINNIEEMVKLKEEYFSHGEFVIKDKIGHRMYSRSLDLYIEFLKSDNNNIKFIKADLNSTLKDIENIEADNTLTVLQKERIILSRVGQGKYRKDLIKLWKGCSITKFEDERLLIASHIKPWKDSNNKEKIDKFNGFLLLPTLDKLFELGFISFDCDGQIIISPQLKDADNLGINKQMKIDLKPENLPYLKFHLESKFKK
jgi:HNH endonuclease